MARNKTIFKEDILEAAEQFLIEKSAKELTARALSKYMNISTQPLYAEFQNRMPSGLNFLIEFMIS